MNKLLRLLLGVLVIIVSAFSVPSWGCDAFGPNRHLGVVTKIDPSAHSFTIIDAQRSKPMTFTASKEILDKLELEQEFLVTFRMAGEQMQAVAVVPSSKSQKK